ncbi:hypothetical protein TRFO_36744 [Tritrichomonas foetus]|uniref:Uncharacterized protein n=1 Tax=Tritrichomonas foetus TaxID=1144522 RepID=A0A1J4JDF5_9EUKA|nr:hypothetical protein TRFO_36744 [Tritrichomonas foetus]|eukprot:OHS97128.1 hypothetical protein TRFO_36744 [Tritrichomonas foetus]
MNNDPGSSVMPFDTTSHAAARSDSAGNRAETTLTQISTSIFDYFFPLVDELTRCVPPNPFMTFISFTILTIQWFATAYFPFLDKTWDFSRFPDIILRDVTFLADFSCGNEDIYVSGIVDVIIPFLGLFIFLWSIWMISYYHWNKTFNRYHVKITQFVYTSVLPLLILPSSFNLGFAINYIDSEFTNYYLIITIFQALSLLFLISLFFLHLVCRASTPYLENTIMSSWDGRPIFFFILGNVFSTVSSRLIKNFPFWARHLLIVGYVGYTLFTLSKLLQFPMIKQTSQVMIFSNAIGAIFCSIFQLLNFSSAIRFFVPLGITLVLYPIVFIVFRIIRKNVLTKPDISTPNKAIRSLRIQIADHCAEFIKFRLIKNITSQCPRTSILAEIAQMLSFFPSESQMLNLYITLLTKRTDLRIDEWFMFYQIRRIHILRQTSNSKQLLDDLAFMKKCTKKTISAFSSFLPRAAEENSYLSIGTLFGLAKMKRETSAVCMETMEKYPNSHLLSYEYSRYIIECEADFKGGIDNYRKGIKL